MRSAVDSLGALILTLQGNGNYAAVRDFMVTRGKISATLQRDLARLSSTGIPVDVVFEQGPSVLGLGR